MIGTKLAHYEIAAHLGTGGMGEVYQATDSRLGRSVAIKLLPEAFTHDPDRAARFEREARVLASLNHPNIAAIHGIEESGGRKFLVMELVPGETLAEKIKRGAIPLDESLGIAAQITEALEAAHDKGVVHRDLKPANIKLTSEGKVKVLDFGLAKAFAGDGSDMNLSNSPTLSMAATKAGVILGTAAYMSPEQAKGKETDRTTDIWAFGCVLFEMLTGHSAFEGESLGEVLGSVFKSEPDWAVLPATTPSAIVSLLKRCLQKNRSRRMRDIADARFQIEDALATPLNTMAPVLDTRRNRHRIVVGALLAVIAALSLLALSNFRSPATDAVEMRLDISTPPGADLGNFAISPDGSNVVFVAPKGGRTPLWIRHLNSETAQPIEGTEGARDPFWSPDSKSIAFYAQEKLKRVEIAGGPVQSLVKAEGNGGSWNTNGVILFAPNYGGALYRIPDTGGEPVAVTSLDLPRVTVQLFPQFLPDGHHFLFFGYGPREFMGIYTGSLDSTRTTRLFAADSNAVFASPDWVLFDRQGALLAQRLDLKTLKPIGDPLRVSPNVALNSESLAIAVSASSVGLIAFRASEPERQLVLVDRANRQIGTVGGPDAAFKNGDLRLSPTGRTIGTVRRIDQASNIWLTDIGTGATRQLTSGAVWHSLPVWSHDEMHILFSSDPTGIATIHEISAMGKGDGNTLLPTRVENYVEDLSPDDRVLLYRIVDTNGTSTIWALPLMGDKKEPLELARNAFNGRFSPDGHWIAYESNETGEPEIWLQPFPPTGSKSQITNNFGLEPQWRRDGRELFFVGPGNWLMAMPLTSNGLKGGDPTRLFLLPPNSHFATSNGQQFLISKIVKDQAPITILQNWKARSE